MAGILFSAETNGEISTGTSKKTILQIVAASNHRVKVKEISVSFKGTSNTAAPILVEVYRQTTAGTDGDAVTLAKFDSDTSETLQTTGLSNIDGSSQPTDSGSALLSEEVHPQGGYTWQAPFGGEIIVPGGARLGLAVTAGADVSSSARMICEE